MVDGITQSHKPTSEERLRIENRKKKDIETAEKLIRHTEKIERKHDKERVPIEQLRSVDMDHLISGEEKEIFKIKRFQTQDLEEISQDNPPLEGHEYLVQSTTPIENIYTQAQQIYQGINSPQEVSRDDFYSAMDIRYAIEAKQEAIQKGTYSPTEKLERETNAIKNIVDEIINWYKG